MKSISFIVTGTQTLEYLSTAHVWFKFRTRFLAGVTDLNPIPRSYLLSCSLHPSSIQNVNYDQCGAYLGASDSFEYLNSRILALVGGGLNGVGSARHLPSIVGIAPQALEVFCCR